MAPSAIPAAEPTMRLPRRALVLVSAALLLAFAKQAYDYNDTTWAFTGAKLKFSAKAKGIGKVHASSFDQAEITLNGDGSWTLDFDGMEVVAGSWTVKDEFDKSIEADVSETGQAEIFGFFEAGAEAAAAAKGLTVDVTLDTAKIEKMKMFVKVNKKTQTARVKMVATLKATGLTDGEGKLNAPTTCAAKFTGISDEVQLAEILP
jgi:hypothetical protein